MRIEDVELFQSDPFELPAFTIVTNYPQTNASWLLSSLATRHDGHVLTLSPLNPLPATDAEADLAVVIGTELPLLAALVDAEQMLEAISSLRKSFKHVVVEVTISEALLNPDYETGRQLARFAKLALYESQLVLQLQPLATGRARDITGRFVVSAGPKSERGVIERSLFYKVNRNNSSVDIRAAF